MIETVLQAPSIIRSPITLAMFESQAHPLALIRSLVPGRRRRHLVVVACWLADLVPNLSPRKRSIYRRMYRHVDAVIVFSANQRAILASELGIDPEKIECVEYGIDANEFKGVAVSESGTVVAVGRDGGRDWETLLRAVDGTGWDVRVACRPKSLEGLTIPDNVTVLGYLAKPEYRELLGAASAVVIATRDCAYPSGQTVLLEAMSLGKSCVVTQTAAMSDYAIDGDNCLTVPAADADALRVAIRRLLADAHLRSHLGRGGKRSVANQFNAEAMWRAIGSKLKSLTTP